MSPTTDHLPTPGFYADPFPPEMSAGAVSARVQAYLELKEFCLALSSRPSEHQNFALPRLAASESKTKTLPAQ